MGAYTYISLNLVEMGISFHARQGHAIWGAYRAEFHRFLRITEFDGRREEGTVCTAGRPSYLAYFHQCRFLAAQNSSHCQFLRTIDQDFHPFTRYVSAAMMILIVPGIIPISHQTLSCVRRLFLRKWPSLDLTSRRSRKATNFRSL